MSLSNIYVECCSLLSMNMMVLHQCCILHLGPVHDEESLQTVINHIKSFDITIKFTSEIFTNRSTRSMTAWSPSLLIMTITNTFPLQVAIPTNLWIELLTANLSDCVCVAFLLMTLISLIKHRTSQLTLFPLDTAPVKSTKPLTEPYSQTNCCRTKT